MLGYRGERVHHLAGNDVGLGDVGSSLNARDDDLGTIQVDCQLLAREKGGQFLVVAEAG